MSLEALGWNEQRRAAFAPHAAAGLLPGRVVGEHRSHLQVAIEAMEVAAGTVGRLRKAAVQRSDLPGVGDFVAVGPSAGDGPATIEAVLPRTSALIRKASLTSDPQLLAANVDVVFIVTALGGDFNLARMQRYLALVRHSGAAPVIIVNKSDLANDVVAPTGRIDGIDADTPVHMISARARDSLQVLERYFAGQRTVALLGSSGVGKSTLTNQVLGRDAQATQDVRGYDGRGRHTTTHRQLFVRPQGGAIIDTPGLRGLELWNAADAGKPEFDDLERLALECRFSNCRHTTEPGCAVRAALERGEIDRSRLAVFIESGIAAGNRRGRGRGAG